MSLDPNYKNELLELIYSNNKIYPFASENYFHMDTVIKILKPRIKDSLSGFAVGYFITKSELKVDQTYLTTISKNNIDIFYRSFARYLIGIRKNMLFRILKLTEMIKYKEFTDLKLLVSSATNSILDNKEATKPPRIRINKVDFIGVIRGFLFLSYDHNGSSYTITDILDILKKEGYSNNCLNIAGSFIGAQLGLNKMIDQGLKMSIYLSDIVGYVNDIPLYMLMRNK
jgi:hypothetical protein